MGFTKCELGYIVESEGAQEAVVYREGGEYGGGEL